ncbi:HPr kinase/phosphorylase-related protein [Coxiella burnetii]|uniref:Hpr(Ser) kinase n=2 Tax=Coxiella burnetii TaxID=777 RepID=Q820W5_COXBU|nr:HPr kinase/phosphorylase-related protein [Coxiella burnetii]NP_819770.1 Hpr(Ser) kinase [Coxiella burnetii RSA 493]AAO90284.1 Hpr(Ser) kinase [Coxiella burnetii RSA 493]ABS77736.1 HPr(Ser) kinase [Coxiella burnetii Dugway 5J108-111]ABX77827.1 HPr kinase/phosphorylase [Coxiella burnetii RSA 331]ACJ20674.1 Hpr(Ser) kinase [Coxiella burnetii CbuK_Q154]AIT63746.1 HPr kinase/phosphorylase [Coxiella burnetii str. Namibia]
MSLHQSPGETPGPLKQTWHANFLVIDKMGVLITGEANIGKSELSLALIDRGHQLVCDDVIDLKQENNQLIGSCPSVANGYILITGIGIIDVPKLFGLDAVVNQHEVHLSISLVKPEKMPLLDDPLNPLYRTEIILGINVPKILFPIHPGRNLPLLIETLVRNHRLKMEGYDSSHHFHEHFRKARDNYDSKKN